VTLRLDPDQIGDLRTLLDETLGDLSHEIADTDNWEYRVALRQRRDRLRKLRDQVVTLGEHVEEDTPADDQAGPV
jgi:hypothetical protein